jgi:hypothetical protein
MILGPETFRCGYRLITSASLSRSSRVRMIVGLLASSVTSDRVLRRAYVIDSRAHQKSSQKILSGAPDATSLREATKISSERTLGNSHSKK